MADSYAIPLQTEHAGDGCVSSNFTLTPMSDTSHLTLRIPPNNIVPVIFVPGIMGSNLVSKKDGARVWPAYSQVRLGTRWAFRSASARQEALSADVTELDHKGTWYGQSATVANEAEGWERGQGTVSKDFYGDFVTWLDNTLNGSIGAFGPVNPWLKLYGKDYGHKWGAQKPFSPLLTTEIEAAWSKYWCPVYANGYNWTRTNAENGRLLAKRIKEIIDFWSSRPHKPTCNKVILVSHSMGGLVCRAAIGQGDILGKAAILVAGVVHGVQPATGAAAAYHHCHKGYGGGTGVVLGSDGAQVSAVFANAPGAMELLPNQLYEVNGKKEWLKARDNVTGPIKGFAFPALDSNTNRQEPFSQIYAQRNKWYGLMHDSYIDPANRYGGETAAWRKYLENLNQAAAFHTALGTQYHPTTYVTYGADKKFPTWNTIEWKGFSAASGGMTAEEILSADTSYFDAKFQVLKSANGKGGMSFRIPEAEELNNGEIGDGTVPSCSGEAPLKQGGASTKQSFRMTGFDHQNEYNNEEVRYATLYAIGKILASLN
ncbi:esterase/lipase family protein [Robbsia andropogonis]|uniref:esterase/lipase family protein n=1 Tax=Robbsia andropogonis TaxID=28092 RepID=UPI0004BCDBCC|nr:hypothetical protein [Robbsia andropogonis]